MNRTFDLHSHTLRSDGVLTPTELVQRAADKGVDLAGTVEASDNPAFKPGDRVLLTGWRVGEVHWGGYATKARVKADWLVPLPDGLSLQQAMAVGTAGFTAMLAVMALEDHGVTPEKGEVLVTGAAGGVGSVAIASGQEPPHPPPQAMLNFVGSALMASKA